MGEFIKDLFRYPVVAIGAVVLLVVRIVGWLLLIAGLLFGAFWLDGEFAGLGDKIVVTLLAGSALLAFANMYVLRRARNSNAIS